MKLHLGCGPHILNGYVNCDMLPLPGVDVVCRSSSLPFADGEVGEILAEHLIEHLTFFEFNQTVAECSRVLVSGGRLILECPDLEAVCAGFVAASEYERYDSASGHWPFIAQLYGHQRGKSDGEILSQVHKSGYTFQRLAYVLAGVGFNDVRKVPPKKARPGNPCLRVEASK